MNQPRGEFPLQGPRPQGLDPMLLDIPLLTDLEFNTHGTSGEHALKEIATWQEFLAALKAQGRTVSAVEDPFSYYLQMGPGRFYRAYLAPGDPMVAGMTLQPNETGGFNVNHTHSIDQTAVTAAAYYKILTRKFFDEFCGLPELGMKATNLTIPTRTIKNDIGLARAAFDFGLVRGDDFIIPMPGVAPFPMEDKGDDARQQVRDTLGDRGITGIFPYMTGEGEIDVTTSEYYRAGVHVGTLIEKSAPMDGTHMRRRTNEVLDTAGREVPLRVTLRDTAEHVHALKTLAESSQWAAGLILG